MPKLQVSGMEDKSCTIGSIPDGTVFRGTIGQTSGLFFKAANAVVLMREPFTVVPCGNIGNALAASTPVSSYTEPTAKLTISTRSGKKGQA